MALLIIYLLAVFTVWRLTYDFINLQGPFDLYKLVQDYVKTKKPDYFLEKLDDAVDTAGQSNQGVVESAKWALTNVGIDPSEDLRILYQQIKEAWDSGILFKSPSNKVLIHENTWPDWITSGFACFYCISWWVGFLVAFLLPVDGIREYLLSAIGISGAVTLTARYLKAVYGVDLFEE